MPAKFIIGSPLISCINIKLKNITMVKADTEPVLLIIDTDGYVVSAGDPKRYSPKQLHKYIQDGCEAKTITIKEYRQTEFKWIYEKSMTEK